MPVNLLAVGVAAHWGVQRDIDAALVLGQQRELVGVGLLHALQSLAQHLLDYPRDRVPLLARHQQGKSLGIENGELVPEGLGGAPQAETPERPPEARTALRPGPRPRAARRRGAAPCRESRSAGRPRDAECRPPAGGGGRSCSAARGQGALRPGTAQRRVPRAVGRRARRAPPAAGARARPRAGRWPSCR